MRDQLGERRTTFQCPSTGIDIAATYKLGGGKLDVEMSWSQLDAMLEAGGTIEQYENLKLETLAWCVPLRRYYPSLEAACDALVSAGCDPVDVSNLDTEGTWRGVRSWQK